jgi:hypothetical protein
MTYYCHRCAAGLGYLQGVYTSDPLQSPYQLDKFIKPTVPLSHPSASIFNSTSTGDYANYVVDAATSGAVELDVYGRRNIIWVAGRPTGFSYNNGALVGPTDGVKVVLSSEDTKVHAFPVSAGNRGDTRVCVVWWTGFHLSERTKFAFFLWMSDIRNKEKNDGIHDNDCTE